MPRSKPAPPPSFPASPSDRSWSAWWRSARFPMVMLGCFGLLIGLLIYFQSTLVVGTEINTADWELRRFSFRRDPFTNTQLTAIRHSSPMNSECWPAVKNSASALPATAISKHLKRGGGLPDRWDLVELSDGGETRGRGLVLVNLVQSPGAPSQYWLNWSNRNPKKAAVFWPAVQQLVARDRYSQLPELFELALYEQEFVDFQNAVSSLVPAVNP